MRTEVTEVLFTSARQEECRTGLLGYLAVVINDELKIDGLTLRRTKSGRLSVSFPGRTDAHGDWHFHIRPLNDAARRELERQVFAALKLSENVQLPFGGFGAPQ